MGKIGLPLAVQYARKGHTVFGVDINSETVDQVNNGIEPFPGEANLQEYLKEVVKKGLLSATLNTAEAVTKSDVVVVAVPLFVDENAIPDFTAIDAAAVQIGKGLEKGTLVIFETTLPIGTTRNRIKRALETISGLKGEGDFYLAFSPERVFTGRVFQDLRKYPKLVGGINQESSQKAVAFYEEVLDFDERSDLSRENGVWDLGSCEAAEMAKLAETTYRDVNIGLANQFAKFASENNINIYKVIEACNSQPFSHIHQPGIAVGGHCIPVYPHLYLHTDPNATIVREARDFNSRMPEISIRQIEEILGNLEGKKILILGIAYRPGVKEIAFSGALKLLEQLNKLGSKVHAHDPLYDDKEIQNYGFIPFSSLMRYDVSIIQTRHEVYTSWASHQWENLGFIYDGRGGLFSNRYSKYPDLILGNRIHRE